MHQLTVSALRKRCNLTGIMIEADRPETHDLIRGNSGADIACLITPSP